MKRVAILISGRGSNMAAMLAAVRAGEIAGNVIGVISNRPAAPGLALASERGAPTVAIDHMAFADRAALERELSGAIDAL